MLKTISMGLTRLRFRAAATLSGTKRHIYFFVFLQLPIVLFITILLLQISNPSVTGSNPVGRATLSALHLSMTALTFLEVISVWRVLRLACSVSSKPRSLNAPSTGSCDAQNFCGAKGHHHSYFFQARVAHSAILAQAHAIEHEAILLFRSET